MRKLKLNGSTFHATEDYKIFMDVCLWKGLPTPEDSTSQISLGSFSKASLSIRSPDCMMPIPQRRLSSKSKKYLPLHIVYVPM